MSILSNYFLIIERIRNFVGIGIANADVPIDEVLKNVFFLGNQARKFDPKNGAISGFLELVLGQHLPVVEVSDHMGNAFPRGLKR